jgi:hypothetical protein
MSDHHHRPAAIPKGKFDGHGTKFQNSPLSRKWSRVRHFLPQSMTKIPRLEGHEANHEVSCYLIPSVNRLQQLYLIL